MRNFYRNRFTTQLLKLTKQGRGNNLKNKMKKLILTSALLLLCSNANADSTYDPFNNRALQQQQYQNQQNYNQQQMIMEQQNANRMMQQQMHEQQMQQWQNQQPRGIDARIPLMVNPPQFNYYGR